MPLPPAEALDEGLLERVGKFKPEILTALGKRPATGATSCYELEPGRRIHHPWDGSKTVVNEGALLDTSGQNVRQLIETREVRHEKLG